MSAGVGTVMGWREFLWGNAEVLVKFGFSPGLEPRFNNPGLASLVQFSSD